MVIDKGAALTGTANGAAISITTVTSILLNRHGEQLKPNNGPDKIIDYPRPHRTIIRNIRHPAERFVTINKYPRNLKE